MTDFLKTAGVIAIGLMYLAFSIASLMAPFILIYLVM